jgi:hypothetical protein
LLRIAGWAASEPPVLAIDASADGGLFLAEPKDLTRLTFSAIARAGVVAASSVGIDAIGIGRDRVTVGGWPESARQSFVGQLIFRRAEQQERRKTMVDNAEILTAGIVVELAADSLLRFARALILGVVD